MPIRKCQVGGFIGVTANATGVSWMKTQHILKVGLRPLGRLPKGPTTWMLL